MRVSGKIRGLVGALLLALLLGCIVSLIRSGGLASLQYRLNPKSVTLDLSKAAYRELKGTENGMMTVTGEDAGLIWNLDGSFRHTLLITAEAGLNDAEPSYLKVYYGGRDKELTEEKSRRVRLHNGVNQLTVPIDGPLGVLRIDARTALGNGFSVTQVRETADFHASGGGEVLLARAVLLTLAFFFLLLHVVWGIDSLYAFLFQRRWLIGACLLALGVLLNLNGSSLEMWKNLLPIDQVSRVFGSPRIMRTDEYNVMTPLSFSQQFASPAYGWTSNLLRGEATDVFMVYALPVRTVFEIFRPFQLGYLLFGAERGLSFFWCARGIVLWLVSFEMMRILTRDRRALSAAGACLILFAPIVQWWYAINSLVEMLIFGFGAVTLLYWFFRDRRLWTRILCTLGIFECAGGYALTLYPAWMIPLAYVFGVLAVWVLAAAIQEGLVRRRDLIAPIGAVLGAAAVIFLILGRTSATVSTVQNTVYPGKRFSAGGGEGRRFFYYPATLFFSALPSVVHPSSVEDSVFFTLFPLGLILSGSALIRQRGRNLLIWLLLGLTVFIGLYTTLGLPPVLAKITFLGSSLAHRADLALGLIQVLLLILGLSEWIAIKEKGKIGQTDLTLRGICLRLIVSLSGSAAVVFLSKILGMGAYYRKYPFLLPLMIVTLTLLTFFCLAADHFQRLMPFSLAAAALVCGLMVNPVEIGSAGLYQTNLAQEVKAVRDRDPGALWASANGADSPMGNYLAMLGVPTVTTTNTYPDLEKWAGIDTGKKEDQVYNRYAHLDLFIVPDEEKNPNKQFEMLAMDHIRVYIGNEDVRKLGIRYLLTTSAMEDLSDETVTYQFVSSAGRYFIYRANW